MRDLKQSEGKRGHIDCCSEKSSHSNRNLRNWELQNAGFAYFQSWSRDFPTLTKRKLLGLKVTSV